MLYGGRVAEEMVFGPEKVTTGAGNDIERATQMARRMVTRFGMSDAVGLMAIGDSDQQVFLGREMTQKRDISEHTAQLVDQEVKRILDEAHEQAREVLEREEDLLERIAQALLERETLDRDDIALLDRDEPLPPLEMDSAQDGRSAYPGAKPEAEQEEGPGTGDMEDDPTRPSQEGESTIPVDREETSDDRDEERASLPGTTARRSRGEPDPDTSRG